MSHYYDEKPGSGHNRRMIEMRLAGRDFVFETDQAVFSRRRIDFGSQLLLETVLEDSQRCLGRLLDLGCGYGAIGIVMKKCMPALEVSLCDINQRAVQLARRNAERNQVKYVMVVASDGLAAVDGSFDLVLTNPPIRAGKQVVYRFFSEAAERLNHDGRLYVVIRKQQGAPSALERLRQLLPNAEVIARSAGYWVIRATREKTTDPAL